MNKYIFFIIIILLLIIAIILLIIKICNKHFLHQQFLQNNLLKSDNIPKIIHKVFIQNSGKMADFPLNPIELQAAHDSWKIMNPEYVIKYYSMNDCREYLKKHFEDSDFLQAFDCLNAYAFKCDFFRYCVLYNEGGWYSDWKQVCLKKNLLNVLHNNAKINILYFNDYGQDTKLKYISNGFMGCIKKNILIKQCINQIINNVKYKYYGNNKLNITGPGLLSQFLSSSNSLGNFIIKDKKSYYNFKNELIILNKCYNTTDNQDWKSGNNYNKLWNNKTLYKDFKIKDTIPKVIHKTGPQLKEQLSPELESIFNKILLQNPEYNLKYYDNSDCYKLIKNNFEPEVLWAYNTLIPTAYKADLFRYALLYLYGGIYSDLSQEFLVPLNTIIDFNKDILILTEDFIHSGYDYPGIQISFICAIPKLPIFKNGINTIIKNCKNLYYGNTPLDITGPYLFKHVLNTINLNYIIKLYQSNNYLINKNNKYMIKTKSKNHQNILYNEYNSPYYLLWKNKNIYKNESINLYQTHKNQQFINNNEILKKASLSWIKYYKRVFYNDNDVNLFIKTYYAEFFDTFNNLPIPVMKADIFRYCVIYIKGGMYSDCDTTLVDSDALKQIKFYNLVLVPENDVHMCQWWFYANKNHRFLSILIEIIFKKLNNINFKDNKLDEHFIHKYTGPGVFTEAFIEYLKNINIDFKYNGKNMLQIFDYNKILNSKQIFIFENKNFHKKIVTHSFFGYKKFGWLEQKNNFLTKQQV